ncbi:hypothetical protein PM3016_5964 [Paenibacillus mucilaginosus 3016]|uniref:Uncharacterized protein n=1 Tax=Paenibacillus mucilaginosus 3016 TaxID=1116391 RepID=H6NPK9_9BACL|nr:hypothetical protein [Paenibacillus mucilaginosus]AFC32621.1 hypothetical protein PM3016_5964 [Paenibacillus mucilaginosus 3016]
MRLAEGPRGERGALHRKGEACCARGQTPEGMAVAAARFRLPEAGGRAVFGPGSVREAWWICLAREGLSHPNETESSTASLQELAGLGAGSRLAGMTLPRRR